MSRSVRGANKVIRDATSDIGDGWVRALRQKHAAGCVPRPRWLCRGGKFCALIEHYYLKAGKGRPPVGLERMLRDQARVPFHESPLSRFEEERAQFIRDVRAHKPIDRASHAVASISPGAVRVAPPKAGVNAPNRPVT